jgi:hypothetical protein
MAVTFDRHLKATRLNVLRRVYKLDASPNGRDLGILEPNLDFGGLHFASPPLAQGGAGALAPVNSAPTWLSIPSSQSSISTAAPL